MYDIFSEYYDSLIRNIDYKKRTAYLLKLFKKYDRIPTLMLDVGCGTGNFTFEFANMGIDMIGVDPSDSMLAVAMDKSANSKVNPLFLCQSAEELDLYGTVDGAVCCLDTLNHITDYNKFKKAIAKISLFLEPERLFIFDVNTVYKHNTLLSQQTYTVEDEDVFCCWQNSKCDKNGKVDITLDFFGKEADGRYVRQTESFSERAYTKEQIETALNKANLSVVAVFDDITENEPTDTSERLIYITRKK